MIKFYLSTVLMWMIILYALVVICEESIKKNGHLIGVGKSKHSWTTALFCMAAVPIVRVAFAFVIILMATKTKEEFDKMVEDLKNGRN